MVAVNQLYGANVFSVVPMARHIVSVMSQTPRLSDSDLVDEIASIGGRKHRSFASKFCHFYVDSKRYPIFDKYVGVTSSAPPPYKNVLAALGTLQTRAKLADLPPRALDRYLWLSGLHRKWSMGTKPKINAEVAALFAAADTDPQLRADISAMCP